MQVSRLLRCLTILLMLGACGKQELLPSDYIMWVHVPINDLLEKKTIPLEVEVLFKPNQIFVLGFEQEEATKHIDKTLIIELDYFKTGPIKLTFETSNLVSIPTLKL